MASKIIKNSGNDFQLVIEDDCIVYQDLKRRIEAEIPYDNIDYVEFNKLRRGNGFTTQLEVIIELLDYQVEFTSTTISMVFVGCYMDYELNPIINFVNDQI